MNLIKRIRNIILWTIYSLSVALILLELGLRAFPVSNPIMIQENSEILRYEPYKKGTWSLGKNFYHYVNIESNNYGYRSNFNYIKNSNPNVMIISDSYVEAWQVNFEESLSGILNNDLKKPVYSLGVSGSPLSQYEAFAIFSEKEFNPDIYVFVIVGNDFDESLCIINFSPGRHCYDENFSLKHTKYKRNFFVYLAKHSYLLNYISFNLNINLKLVVFNLLDKVKKIFVSDNSINKKITLNNNDYLDKNIYVGNTTRNKDKDIELLSAKAIKIFFRNINELLKNKSVIFILDSDRNYQNFEKDIQDDESFFSKMRVKVKNEIKKYDFKIIDMDPIFRKHYKTNKIKFEFKTDGHWNSLAHKLVAREVIKALD